MGDPIKIENNLFSSELDEKTGMWITKAKPVSSFKTKEGKLKPKYRDLPRVKAIYEIEENIKREYKETIQQSIIDINNQLIKFSGA